MPAIMQLQGPGAKLGCVGCTRPTTQGVPLAGAGALAGASNLGAIFTASPFTLVMGLAFGAFLAWRYALPPARGALSGRRR